MKPLHLFASFLLCAGLLPGSGTVARAQTTPLLLYHVTMDTSQLQGHTAGPFSLQFTFIDGSGLGDSNGAVIVTNFNFGAGGDVEGASDDDNSGGDLTSFVTLTDDTPECDFSEQFDAGTNLTFDLYATLSLDAGLLSDEFQIAILDSESQRIPTLDTNDEDVLVRLTTSNGFSITVETYGTDPAVNPVASGPPVSFGPLVLLDGTAPPGPPTLNITLNADGSAAVCWPALYSDFTLQETADFTNWISTPIEPATIGTNSTVLVDPSEAPLQYYRLAQ
jgi:hypothetical protein